MENSQQLSQRLERLRATRLSGSDYYGGAAKRLGVDNTRADSLRETLRGTEKAFTGLESSVGGRTVGSLVSEAQRRGMVQNERQPLVERIQAQSGALGKEISTQQDLREKAREQASSAYKKTESQIESVQQQYKTTLKAEEEAAKRAAERREFEKRLQTQYERMKQLEDLSARLRGTAESAAKIRAKYGFAH